MKYKNDSRKPINWTRGTLNQFKVSVTNIINQVLKNEDPTANTTYILGKFNLLMNEKKNLYDGQPEKSYPPCSIV